MHRSNLPGLKTRVLSLTALLAVLVATGAPAGAHPFLVDSDPVQGDRLLLSPGEVVLRLTEPAILDSALFTVRSAAGEKVSAGPLRDESGGRVLRLPLPRLDQGIYLVSWHVMSAVDAHESAGEFAFAVGDVAGALPDPRPGPDSLSIGRAAARWGFLVGFGWALGALASRRFLPGVIPVGTRPALLLALIAAVADYSLAARAGRLSLAALLAAKRSI